MQHTIKRKGFSGIKFTSNYQQSSLHHLQKTEDRFDEGYDIDGKPRPFYYVEYIEDTQYFDEDTVPDFFPLMLLEIFCL